MRVTHLHNCNNYEATTLHSKVELHACLRSPMQSLFLPVTGLLHVSEITISERVAIYTKIEGCIICAKIKGRLRAKRIVFCLFTVVLELQ